MAIRAEYAVRERLRAIGAAALLLPVLAGCQAMLLPSARFVSSPSLETPSPTPATPVESGPATDALEHSAPDPGQSEVAPETAVQTPAAVEAAEPPPVAPKPDSPSATEQRPTQSASETPAPAQTPQPPASAELKSVPTQRVDPLVERPLGIVSERLLAAPQTGGGLEITPCDMPLVGLCGADPCPPLLVLPHCRWRRYLGPLFSHDQSAAQTQLAEAELQAPHSLFHPVPTSPVFGPRYDYEPAQLMMTPVRKHGLSQPPAAPGALPPMSELTPLAPQSPPAGDTTQHEKDLEPIPVPADAVPDPGAPPPHLDPKNFSPSADRTQSVLKRK